MSINTCLIYRCLSSASAVIRSWFIYELQKSTTIASSRNLLYTFCSRNPTCGIPPCLRISNRRYLPMPSEFHNREPPLPFGNPKSRPWYGMDIFWNRPFQYINIHTWLHQAWGNKTKEIILRLNNEFFCFIPPSLGAKYEF